ncbi:MAG: hypothetical protein WC792_01310 [Candidatus Micrarchaeia archaeon]|jgi:hypothetical protein
MAFSTLFLQAASAGLALDLFGDIEFWGTLLWWLFMAFIAWWLYKWAEEHLAFSPVLTLAVAFVLIWFMVIEHPEWGIAAFGISLLLFSGIIWLLPILLLPFGGLFKKH